MARPIWKGMLCFGLVSIPVALYAAETPLAHLDLDMLDARDHSRVRFRRVSEKTGREVPWESVVKGYKVNRGYVVLDKEDLERAARDVVKGIQIQQFVAADAISPLYFEKPYYIIPQKGAEKVYVLLRDTLRHSGRAGIARMVVRQREYLAAVLPEGDAIAVITLRFADEVRPASEVSPPQGAGRMKATAEEVKLAEDLISAMSKDWSPARFHDEYREALMKIIKSKARTGEAPPEPQGEEEESTGSADLLELLRRSVTTHGPAARRSGRARARKRPAKRAKRTAR